MMFLTLLAVGSFLSQSAFSQNFTASTCVSPSGYNTCMEPVNSYTETCIANSNGDTSKIAACGCVANLGEINCALENCWNVVYGCEYQNLAVNWVAYCSGDDVPFFPAPDNAPGGCSCNLGYVYLNVTNSLTGSPNCITGDLNRNDACFCCSQAIGYTALYDICPQVDPTYFQAADLLAEVFEADDPQIGQCGQLFGQYNCVNDLGYPAVGNLPYLTSLPTTTGTLSYSTTSGSITAPLSGATFTWTALGQPQAITAVDATKVASSSAKSMASSSGTHSSAAVVGSTQSTGTQSTTASASAASTSHSSSSANQAQIWQGSSFVMVIIAAVWNI